MFLSTNFKNSNLGNFIWINRIDQKELILIIDCRSFESFYSPNSSSSACFPLHDSLIVSTDTEQIVVELASAEGNSDDVLGVSSETSWDTSFSAWVSEDLDEAEVVTTGNQRLVLARVDTVDVGTVSSPWEDSVDAPAKLAVLGGPISSGGV